VSRDVIFYEDDFPLSRQHVSENPDQLSTTPPQTCDENESIDLSSENYTTELTSLSQDTDLPPDTDSEDTDHHPQSPTLQPPTTQGDTIAHQKYTTDLDGNAIPLPDKRPRQTPTKLNDYFCSFATSTGHSKGTAYPMHEHISYKRLTKSHKEFLDKVSTTCEPSSYKQASGDPLWVQAMAEELEAMTSNNT